MNNGRVYWITGVKNSGKTTIGTALYYRLRKKKNNVIIIDGDLMKEIASGSEVVGYEPKDRMLRAKRYAKVAKLLADQGNWVIICAIAMFDEIREWNRKEIKGYIEVFLDVDAKTLGERAGLDGPVELRGTEFPKTPDLVLKNDGSIPIRDEVDAILGLSPANNDDYDRDREYWNRFYSENRGELLKPSDFAVYVAGQLKGGAHILELGCGNGRDSLYFLQNGYSVVAVDGSDIAIDYLNEDTADEDRALFVCDDFVKCQTIYQIKYDCIYSRFTLHAISEQQEDELLGNVLGGLRENGIFCIEARTIHDEIYGKGEKVAHNAYLYNDHFRRFIDVDEFRRKLERMGFEIIFLEEKNGFSKTENSDPVLMRCIAGIRK